MSTYRFRYLRTMYDKIVGVAVEKPNGELIMQVGTQLIQWFIVGEANIRGSHFK